MTSHATDHTRLATFCTLFDKSYLLFGLALHRSLVEMASPFRLFVLAMDEICEDALRTLALPHVVVIPLRDVLTPKYAFACAQMSSAQLCWTCQPLLCRHVLDQPDVAAVTYLEADSYFFASPQPLFAEVGDGSVSVVPHHYAPGKDYSATSGRYCVQFNLFRNDALSRQMLDEWEQACLTYDRRWPEAFPGQRCLDHWPDRSPAVHIIRNIGAGVAPWNQARYRVGQRGNVPTVDGRDVIFYHYHGLAFVDNEAVLLSTYPLSRDTINFLYWPYLRTLRAVRAELLASIPEFTHAKRFASPGWRSIASPDMGAARRYVRFLFHRYYRGRHNIVRFS